jgi:hypothetical protein
VRDTRSVGNSNDCSDLRFLGFLLSYSFQLKALLLLDHPFYLSVLLISLEI